MSVRALIARGSVALLLVGLSFAATCSVATADALSRTAVAGTDTSAGYLLSLATRDSSNWRWRALATLNSGVDADGWTGYQCLSGNGRWVLAVVAPRRFANDPVARDRGASAFVVSTASGNARALSDHVSLKYHVAGCGQADTATLTRSLGVDQRQTEVLVVDLAHATVTRRVTLAGQVTSVVPLPHGRFAGVVGSQVVRFDGSGRRSVIWHQPAGQPYELRPSSDGIDFLSLDNARRVDLWHVPAEPAGAARSKPLASGRAGATALFLGTGGRNVAVGFHGTSRHFQFAEAPRSGRPLGAALDGSAVVSEAVSAIAARRASGTPRMRLQLTSARSGTITRAATSRAHARTTTARAAAAPGAHAATNTTTPKCAVPRNDLHRQVPQPTGRQVVWAIEQAVRGNLKGSVLTRPAGFLNLGLAAYQPSNDFSPGTLHGTSGRMVPPSIVEATDAQESNFDQASFHALPGVSGNPLIADYYGSAGGISQIDYDQADCGYGLSQLTDGMATTDTSLSANGKTKVVVDYAENVAAGLQVLVAKWNQLYDAGVTVNNADPQYIENWYFALWAYNTGFHANTGGRWGLGWTNNPQNADYPPDRQPFLRTTYADAAHPGDWPYQERVLGFAETPLLDYRGHRSYPPTPTQVVLPAHDAFCTAADECSPTYHDPSNPTLDYCQRADRECWWHGHIDFTACPNGCTSSTFSTTASDPEPAPDDTYPPQCSSQLSATTVIVDEQPSNLNVEGCGSSNWTSQGTFTIAHGQDGAGTPIGVIDWHQLGTGFGGHLYFTHNRPVVDTAHIETGTWTPPTLTAGLYSIQAHIPVNGATAEAATYRVNVGNGTHQDVIINQHVNANRWVELGDFNLQPGANVVLTNVNGETPGTKDIAYDAMAFTFVRTPRPNDNTLAARFEPVFRFDSLEQWRPLNLESFASETDGTGAALHRTCMPYDSPDALVELGTNQPPSTPGPYDKTITVENPDHSFSEQVIANCPPLTTLSGLTRFRSTDAYLDLNGLGDSSSSTYASPHSSCHVGSLLDCNGNESNPDSRSAVYYYITDTSGYTFIQYWLFYRFNSFADTPSIDRHEGDWEAMAVAPSANGATFDFASFTQHKYWYSYLRPTLECFDQTTLSCGTEAAKQGQRINDYIASGSHANYPKACLGSCLQADGSLPERTHDGTYVWGHAFDGQGLLAAPTLSASSWFNWAGRWGTTGDPDGTASPVSPAEHKAPSFQQPWERCGAADTGCALPSRVRPSGPSGPLAVAASQQSCGAWFGTNVAAVVCTPESLRHAVATHDLRPLKPRVSIAPSAHRRADAYVAASAHGLSQMVGPALRRGDRLTLNGPLKHAGLSVRVASERGGPRIIRADVNLGTRRDATYVVAGSPQAPRLRRTR